MIETFLVEFIKMIFREGLVKYPKDSLMQLNYAYFATIFLHNPYLASNFLRSFNYHSMGWIEKLAHKLNEALLLYNLRNIMKGSAWKSMYDSGYRKR